MSFSRPTTDKEREILRYVKFNRAAEGDDVERVRKFLKRNPKVPSHVLSDAVSDKHFKIVDLLLSLPNFELTPKTLWASFGDAIQQRNEGLALRFLDRGADPNEPLTILKETPLILAAQRGMHALIGRLVKKGAKLDTQDASVISEMLGKPLGKTALMHATQKGDEDTVSLLLSFGCDVNARGEHRITALDIALRSKKRKSIANLLQNRGGRTAKELDAKTAKLTKPHRPVESLDKLPTRLSVADGAGYLARQFSFVASPHPHIDGVTLLSKTSTSKREHPQNALRLAAEKVFAGFLSRGLHIFYTSDRDIPPCLALFAARDTFKIVQKFRTANSNYDVTNKSLSAFLRELDQKHLLVVVGCGSAFVECRFEGPIKGANKLAQQLFDFCPFVLSGHGDNLVKFARHLERVGTFSIWWD